MDRQNIDIIRLAVKETGEFLDGKLEPVDGLSQRNPWAHLWKTIKNEMGKSYKDCDDTDVPKILGIIRQEKAKKEGKL